MFTCVLGRHVVSTVFLVPRPLGGCFRAQELYESRGGCPGVLVPNKPTVSVDVKQRVKNRRVLTASVDS